ncbi:hypothetical protein Ahy_A09g043387 [Arachis hypogaea]|uniref:Replication factor A C-terminal domain-containing protein n=1 Tax=Arachis hypogaea TaxID=3818 RepID=A0A445BIA6_ARAHY|nr:hypothetical protein Ahy_A09g043387 [Arachis hypogaea]
MADIHKIANINPTIDNLCVPIRVIWLWTLSSYGNSSLPYSIEMSMYIGLDIKQYRIKLGVIDDSDCACYVVFDNETKQVLEESCVEILDPLLLIFLFIIEVQIYDISYFSPSYKVKKMTNNVNLINKFKEAHPIQINLLLEFSIEVAANDESEFDYPRSREIRRWKEIPQLARRSRLIKKLENLDAHVLESLLESI